MIPKPPSRIRRAIILDNDCPPPHTERLLDGNVHVRVDLPCSLPYRVEATSDFENWEPVLSGVVLPDDGAGFIECETDTFGQRFYRVVPELELEPDDD